MPFDITWDPDERAFNVIFGANDIAITPIRGNTDDGTLVATIRFSQMREPVNDPMGLANGTMLKDIVLPEMPYVQLLFPTADALDTIIQELKQLKRMLKSDFARHCARVAVEQPELLDAYPPGLHVKGGAL